MGLPTLKLEAAFGFGPLEPAHRVLIGGDGGRLWSSQDQQAQVWAERDTPVSGISDNLTGIGWSPDGALAVGASGIILTSPDGITWTQQAAPSTNYTPHDAVWADELGLWLVPAHKIGISEPSDTVVWTSPDGVVWSVQPMSSDGSPAAVAWNGSLAVLVDGFGASIFTSSDGEVWTERSHPATVGQLLGVAWSPSLGLWVVVGADPSTILTSPDGVTWTERTSPFDEWLIAVAWSEPLGLFVAGGDTATDPPARVIVSDDGVSWSTVEVPTDGISVTGIRWAEGPGRFVAVGDDGLVMVSADGTSWSRLSGFGSTNLRAVGSSGELMADLTGRLRLREGFDWGYGRQHELDRMEAGTGSVTLDNRDRALDPENGASPFAGQVRPMVRLRMTATFGGDEFAVFEGFAEAWQPDWPGKVDATVHVPIVDGTKLLSMARTSTSYPEQTSGSRIAALLDAAGWLADLRNLDDGQSTVQAYDPDDRIVLNAIRDTAATEDGVFLVGPDGRAVFRDRHRRVVGTPHAVFGDDRAGGELPYVELDVPFDDSQIWNDIAVQPEGLSIQRAEDDGSQRLYGRRLLERSGTLHTSDAEASDLAHWLRGRYATPRLRVDAIQVLGHADDQVMGQILARKPGDRITVRRRPPGGGDPIEVDVHIEHVRHEVSGLRWTTVWRLSPAHSEMVWILEEPGFGELGVATRLSY